MQTRKHSLTICTCSRTHARTALPCTHACTHPHWACRYEEQNKMGPQNVAIVFGPTLLRQTNQAPDALMRDSSYQSAVVEQILSRLDWCVGAVWCVACTLSLSLSLSLFVCFGVVCVKHPLLVIILDIPKPHTETHKYYRYLGIDEL